MKTKNQKDEYIIYPDRIRVAVAIIFAAIMGFFAINNIGGYLPKHRYPWLWFILWIFLVLSLCKKFILRYDSITVKLFFITLQKISWIRVNQIMFFHEFSNGREILKQDVALITLHECVPFYPQTDKVGTYLFKHPIGAKLIYIPEGKWDEYVAAFEKYKRDNIKIEFL